MSINNMLTGRDSIIYRGQAIKINDTKVLLKVAYFARPFHYKNKAMNQK
jgi:hypothetical protein